MDCLACQYPDASVVLACHRAGIPCTIHVALGTDIVHMHPHVSGAALGPNWECSRIAYVWTTCTRGQHTASASVGKVKEPCTRPRS